MPANDEGRTHDDLHAEHVFDGGAMDCGSGLILLIRENMLQVPEGGVLEIRSTEPTVATELPPWCRMTGHQHVGSLEELPGRWRHFVRRRGGVQTEDSLLQSDKERAQAFVFKSRARMTGTGETTVYSRNFSWKSGSSFDFDKQGTLPTALEQLIGSLMADILASFMTRCSRHNITIDELEITASATLHNVLTAMEMEAGDPSLKQISLVAYFTSPNPEAELRAQWQASLLLSPIHQTISKACVIESRLVSL